jgi:signal transduction histidine kinase
MDAIIGVMHRPAAIVADGEVILSANEGWSNVADRGMRPGRHASLRECLSGFAGVEALIEALQSNSVSTGVLTLDGGAGAGPRSGAQTGELAVRWQQIDLEDAENALAVLVLEDQSEVPHLVSAINAQRAQIQELLIRQTLIEEKERRRIGRSLHDGLGQDLAHLRAMVLRSEHPTGVSEPLVAEIDRAIQNVRDLTFELSPPILEDLGLLPALHWLAEYLGQRFKTHIAVADDGVEPGLPAATRTIAFRAVRELAINAAKHASDAEIILTCLCNQRFVQLCVRDTGAGFDPGSALQSPVALRRYGLISVEQQIRGIGGTFNLISTAGEGTRAAITLPLHNAEGAPGA